MSLSLPEAQALFGRMLDGAMGDDEIRDTLIALADRGETVEEIAGAVLAMRGRMIALPGFTHAIDVCGTGGDGSHSLNVSTAVALVVAACGVPVAKHGNRAASSKAGAADTLEALGLDLANASVRARQTLDELGIAFFFAQAHHPALGRIAPIRKALGRRTIFNLLGPLANPAGVKRQLVGVSSPDLVAPYARVMALLGTERAIVVSGEEGLDELSIAGPSAVATVGLSGIPASVTPSDAALPSHPLEAIRGGDAAFNAGELAKLLDGAPGAYRNAVVLNAAAALIAAGSVDNLVDGAALAAEAIDSGRAKDLLARWVEMTH